MPIDRIGLQIHVGSHPSRRDARTRGSIECARATSQGLPVLEEQGREVRWEKPRGVAHSRMSAPGAVAPSCHTGGTPQSPRVLLGAGLDDGAAGTRVDIRSMKSFDTRVLVRPLWGTDVGLDPQIQQETAQRG